MDTYMYQYCIFMHIILILKFTNYILYVMPCTSFRCPTTIHPVPTGYKCWPSGSSELCSCENSSTYVKYGLVEVSVLRNSQMILCLIHFKYLGSMKLQHASHIFFSMTIQVYCTYITVSEECHRMPEMFDNIYSWRILHHSSNTPQNTMLHSETLPLSFFSPFFLCVSLSLLL